MKRLFEVFRQSFDESYVRFVWDKNRHLMTHASKGFETATHRYDSLGSRETLASRPETFSYLASGLVFSAWRMRTSLPTSSGGRRESMDLVLKVPHSLSKERLGPTFRSWQTLLRRCPDQLALLPPLALVESKDGFGLVMPFASQPLSQAASYWQPMAERIRELGVALSTLGLALNDPLTTIQGGLKVQAGCWSGIPFIYDLSELGPVP